MLFRKKLKNKEKSSFLVRVVLMALVLAFIFGIIGLISIFILVKDLPSPGELGARQIIESTKIYDREGETLLYELFEEERRTVISYENIPQIIKDATVAIEDGNFFNHKAIDVKGIIRALLVNLQKGGVSQGGSTITQQLAKNAFLSSERTWSRKAKELVLALRLENEFSKEDILGLYINQIPYGANAYGIESATRTYFGKTVEEINLAEAALLASLPQAPSYFSPWGSHVEDLMARKNLTLKRMQDFGLITEEEMTDAQAYQLEFEEPASSIKAPHFSIAIQEYLSGKFGEEFVRRAGLKVFTTLDWELQKIAEKVVEEGVERNSNLYNGTNGALFAQDTNTGQILAMVGSKDYFDIDNDGNFNVAVQGLRQPGSAMKPFVYLTAFKNGFTPETIVFDALTEFDASGQASYQPHNFDNIFRGPVNLRTALAQSINVPAVKTLYLAGVNDVLQTMEDFGVSTLTEKARFGLSLVLGGGEVTLKELVGAYSVLAEEGIYRPQTMILRIEDRNGKVLEEYKEEGQRVVSAEYPRIINDILTDLEARAGLFQSSFNLTVFPGHEVALKTGTTNDYRDAWSFGYTPNFAVGVWAGNNDNTPMSAQGSSILAAIPMWNAFLSEALKTQESDNFPSIPVEKPGKAILEGESIVVYESGGKTYPQVHNILFYVNKKDPRGAEPRGDDDSQYENWEGPVLEWAKTNVRDFNKSGFYNQILPSNAQPVGSSENSLGFKEGIKLISPENGDELRRSEIDLQFQIKSPAIIKRVSVYFNNLIIDQRVGFFSNVYSYDFEIRLNPEGLRPQNKLKILVKDEEGNSFEKEIILFSD